MKFSFQGIGAETVTFETAATADDIGKVCKSDGGKAAVCSAGDGFFGVIRAVRGGAASVQTKGYIELPYTGQTAPATGWCALAADGSGGVKADADGHEFLVVSVDTTAGTLGMWL